MTASGRFSRQEETANAISHGMGVLLGIGALILMVAYALQKGTIWHVVSGSIFGGSMILVYFSSTLNHSLPPGTKGKDFFHNFDQIAIFLMIAGTYTPLSLVALNGNWGWVLFIIEWGIALTGIILKIFIPNKFEKGVNIFYVIAYIIMGWMLLFFIIPLFNSISLNGILWLLGGGLCYTTGILFFKVFIFHYHHLIWHLFVIAGSACHFIAIYFFVLPLKV